MANNYKYAVAASILFSQISSTNLYAQDEFNFDEINLELEELIVSARKREEKLQNTPVAITALNSDLVEDYGIGNIQDLDGLVPSLRLSPGTGTAKSAQAFIRGVGRRDVTPGSDAAILVYIDGIYMWRPEAGLIDTMDLESIEVLRGPQGTLFGKNTTAGAILTTSRKPTQEFYTIAQAKVGNLGRLDGKVIVNSALTDSLMAKVIVSSKHRDGYMENIVTGNDLDNEERLSFINQYRWMINEEDTWDLNLGYSKRREYGRVGTCEFGGYNYIQSAQAATLIQALNFESICNAASQDALGDWKAKNNYESEFNVDHAHVISNLNIDLGDVAGFTDGSFKWNSGWIGVDATFLDGEQDGTEITLLHGLNKEPFRSKQFTNEFQFTGDALDGRLSQVAGLFFSFERLKNDVRHTNIFDVSTLLPAFPIPAGGLYASVYSDVRNWSWGIFGQTSYELNDEWEVTAGLRFTEEQRELGAYAVRTLGSVGGAPDPTANTLDSREKERFSSVTPMVSLRWDATEKANKLINTDSFMTYVTLAKGFKAGGFSIYGEESIEEYDPEELTSLEVGVKLEALDRRLRFNGAVYNSDYKDMQLLILELPPGSSSPTAATRNAGESSIYGAEVELTYLPWRSLMLILNAAYTHAEYDEFYGYRNLDANPADLELEDRSGEAFSQIPEWTAYFAAQYTFATDHGEVVPRMEFVYRDEIFYSADSGSYLSGVGFADSYTVVNANLTWRLTNDTTTIKAFVKNLGDKNYHDSIAGTVDGVGNVVKIQALPRTYGLEFTYLFGD